MMRHPGGESQAGFQLTNEEFPALEGATSIAATANGTSTTTIGMPPMNTVPGASGGMPGSGNVSGLSDLDAQAVLNRLPVSVASISALSGGGDAIKDNRPTFLMGSVSGTMVSNASAFQQATSIQQAMPLQQTSATSVMQQTGSIAKSGIQIATDGTVTNIPAGMIRDQFGMVGLLACLRALETDQQIVQLALGQDLTQLGLNLNAPEYEI